MIDVRQERTVAASPREVWELLSAFDRLAEWADDVEHSSYLTAQTVGVGAARRVQMGSTVLLERVVAWEPQALLAYELEGLPGIVSRVVNEWTIVPDRAASRVALTAHITPGPRPPMRIAAKALGRSIGKANGGLLDGLARAAERTNR